MTPPPQPTPSIPAMRHPPTRKKHAAKVSLVASAIFHVVVIGALAWFAAREGYLGKQLRTIAVSMAPKPKPPEPEKPKEPEKKPEPTPEPKPATPQPATLPPATQTPPRTAPANANAAPPPVAPPANSLPAFAFSDGAKAVESTSDPVQLYRAVVEFSLRSKWLRPDDLDDGAFVAEVDLAIDPSGRILGHTWKSGSGNARWDESVRRALAATTALSRPPPRDFPARFTVRFDVVAEADATGVGLGTP